MLCVSVIGPGLTEAREQIFSSSDADFLELRIDLLDSHIIENDLEELAEIVAQSNKRIILTNRAEQNFVDKIKVFLEYIPYIIPQYVDVDWQCDLKLLTQLESVLKITKSQLIVSHHNWNGMPQDLNDQLRQMEKRIPQAAIYKIIGSASSGIDALKMLAFQNEHKEKVIAHAMGMDGQISRLCGPLVDQPITFLAPTKNKLAAPGQFSIEQYISHCGKRKSDEEQSKIYGLLGDPVSKSRGVEVHNSVMQQLNLPGRYGNLRIPTSELTPFFDLLKSERCKNLFGGLSVTMPHKEAIGQFLDYLDPQAEKAGAVNTIVLTDGALCGFNTDGSGALRAITPKIHGSWEQQRVAIIGTGGTARGIATAALSAGAEVTLCGRSPEKAHRVAKEVDCQWVALSDFQRIASSGYDILIHCTPIGMEGESGALPIRSEEILPGSIVLDVVQSPEGSKTQLLREAEKQGATGITGTDMYLQQALEQLALWFPYLEVTKAESIARAQLNSIQDTGAELCRIC